MRGFLVYLCNYLLLTKHYAPCSSWLELSRSLTLSLLFFCPVALSTTRAMSSSFLKFLAHTQRSTTVGRFPLDEESAHRWDLCTITQHSHEREIHDTCGIRTKKGERPQTFALDRAASVTGLNCALEYDISTRYNTGIIFRSTCLLYALGRAVISANVCETESLSWENKWRERISLKFM
jgi:hypothetical protein